MSDRTTDKKPMIKGMEHEPVVSHRIPNQADISQVMKAFDPNRVGPEGESIGHLYYDWEVRELMKRYHRYGG